MSRLCIHCGAELTAPRRKYCSPDCCRAQYKANYRIDGRAAKLKAKYLAEGRFDVYNARRRTGPYRAAAPCPRCDAPIPAGRRRYCSDVCVQEARAEQRRAQARARDTPERQRARYRRRRLRIFAARLAISQPSATPLLLPPAPRPLPRGLRCDTCRTQTRQCYTCTRQAARLSYQKRKARQAPASRVFIAGECPSCGDSFVTTIANVRYCSTECTVREQRRRTKHRRRTLTRNGEGITLLRLARRDGWRCHICHRRITRRSWSIDHLVPLNSLRSNTGPAQLRLAA